MKRQISNILTGVVGVTLTAGLWSCSAETPFDNDGVGTVHLRTVVNTITTRAEDETDADNREQYLRDKCVVYISDENGLVYKEVGLDNVKPAISLKTGHYVAEAWSGDSVTASFDKMFFRGYQPFDVTKGSESNVVVDCKIRNVVVSINTETINTELIKDYKVIVKNTRGSLEFTPANAATNRGYFMMPNKDTKLDYTIEVTRKDGETVPVSGTIENVESAHQYILNFTYDNITAGGGGSGYVMFEIKIKDEDLTTGNVSVPSAPTVTGVEYDIEKQLVYTGDEEIPNELAVKVCGFGNGLNELKIDSSSDFAFGESASYYQKNLALNINLLQTGGENIDNYNHAGISWVAAKYNSTTDITTAYLKFSRDFIRNLSARDNEHVINIRVTDAANRTTIKPIRIARSGNAIHYDDPIVMQPIDTESNPMSVTGTTATLTFTLGDDYEGTPGVEYRKAGDTDTSWTFVAANSVSNAPRKTLRKAPSVQTVTITGLETGTTYQYRACCGDFHSKDIMTLTTEERFIIPYANMEIWNSFKIAGTNDCTLPGTSVDEFWGNGNPGSMTMNVTLTQASSDMFTSGQYSAKLRSQFVGLGGSVGKFAAGNLFAGTYLETQGTDGHLMFGRPYNGSHPQALRVMANYRPGTVNKTASEAPLIVKGDLDIGQIYIALTTNPIEIFTKKAIRKLFNPEDPEILAYGEYTFNKENYGPDGQLQELVIPFNYYDKAKEKGNKPAYIVIVCTASKFGDYFCGGEGSTLYLDDFELVY